jgi:arginase family enzyme
MPAVNRLHILTWPFHNGLRDVGMGSGATRLATYDECRAGIEAEGITVTSEEIEAVDEADPEIVRVHVNLDSLDADEGQANKYAAAGGPSLVQLLECIRLTTERLEVAGAAITACDPAFDSHGRTMTAARAIAHEIARGIRFQRARGIRFQRAGGIRFQPVRGIHLQPTSGTG